MERPSCRASMFVQRTQVSTSSSVFTTYAKMTFVLVKDHLGHSKIWGVCVGSWARYPQLLSAQTKNSLTLPLTSHVLLGMAVFEQRVSQDRSKMPAVTTFVIRDDPNNCFQENMLWTFPDYPEHLNKIFNKSISDTSYTTRRLLYLKEQGISGLNFPPAT